VTRSIPCRRRASSLRQGWQNASSDFVLPGQYCTDSCQQTVEAEFELGATAQIIDQLT
jgi:hypothetical protein